MGFLPEGKDDAEAIVASSAANNMRNRRARTLKTLHRFKRQNCGCLVLAVIIRCRQHCRDDIVALGLQKVRHRIADHSRVPPFLVCGPSESLLRSLGARAYL